MIFKPVISIRIDIAQREERIHPQTGTQIFKCVATVLLEFVHVVVQGILVQAKEFSKEGVTWCCDNKKLFCIVVEFCREQETHIFEWVVFLPFLDGPYWVAVEVAVNATVSVQC
jgi:hypothetical protein